MKRYTRSDIELKFPFKETTTEYYLADDVADLAERVLPRLRQLGYRISTEEGETICQEEIPSLDNLIAELEQIGGK